MLALLVALVWLLCAFCFFRVLDAPGIDGFWGFVNNVLVFCVAPACFAILVCGVIVGLIRKVWLWAWVRTAWMSNFFSWLYQ